VLQMVAHAPDHVSSALQAAGWRPQSEHERVFAESGRTDAESSSLTPWNSSVISMTISCLSTTKD